MKSDRIRAMLAVTAAVTAIALTGCGSSGTISSLTDSDSTASIAEGAATAANTVQTASVSAAESASAASAVPEILPQTVAATEVGATPSTNAGTDSNVSAPVRISLTGTGEEEEEAAEEAASTTPAVEMETQTALAGAAESQVALIEEDTASTTPAPEEESFESAGEGNMGYVTGDEVNVRSEPEAGDDDNVLFTVFSGDEVKILESEDDWYKIEYDGETGWIKASYVES